MAISTKDYQSLIGRKVIDQNNNVGVIIDISKPDLYSTSHCIRVCSGLETIWYDQYGYTSHGKGALEIKLLKESDVLSAELQSLMNSHKVAPEKLIALLLEEHC